MDIKKFVKLNDKGEIEFDEKGFESEYDSAISKAVDKYANGKGKEEIRKQLEEEAKLSAEEKLKQERAKFEEYKLQETIKLNQAKAAAKLDNKIFAQEEIDFYLSTVNADEEKSLTAIDTIVEARKKFMENMQKSAIENLQKQQQLSDPSKTLPKPDDGEPAKPAVRTKADILSHYRPTQN